MTMKNNWGVWIDSEIPSAGVISANKVNMEFLDGGICLDCEKIWEERSDEDEEFEVECFDHTFLYGDWKKDENGKYIHDEDGEFAAIYTQGSFNDITVVWSKFTTRGTPCSPCAPSCVSIPDDEEPGEFLCYTLPDYLLERE